MIRYKIEPCISCHSEKVKDFIHVAAKDKDCLTTVGCHDCGFQISKWNASRKELIGLWNRLSKFARGIDK